MGIRLPVIVCFMLSAAALFCGTEDMTFGHLGIPAYSQTFGSSYPAVQWGQDAEGNLYAAVLKRDKTGNPQGISIIGVTRDGEFFTSDAARVPEKTQFVGSRVAALPDGLAALVHVRISGRTGIYVLPIDGQDTRELASLPAVPLRQPHEFRDWSAAVSADGDLFVVMNESGGAFKNSSAISLARIHDPFSRIPVTSVSEIYRTQGYVTDPRILVQDTQTLVVWKEGGMTDRTELVLALLDDGYDAAVLHREPAGMAFTSSVGLTATHTPPVLYPRLRDPGLIVLSSPSGTIHVVFHHVVQTQTALTVPHTHMEIRTFSLEFGRIDHLGTFQVTDTKIMDFTYPGMAVIFRDNELLLPYIREFYREGKAVSDPMIAWITLDEKGIPAAAEMLPVLRSPRFIASVALLDTTPNPRYIWLQKALDNEYQIGTIKPDTHPFSSLLPVIRYGNLKESVVSSALTLPAAIAWAAAAGTLGGLPGLLFFWCFLIALQRRRPDLLHTRPASILGLGIAGIIALMQAFPFIPAVPAGPAGIAWTFLFPVCFYYWARGRFSPGIGYARFIYAAWAGTIIFTVLAAWPKVFSALEHYMHLQ